MDTFENFHRGGFTCAVRTQQAKTGSGREAETDTIHRLHLWVMFDELTDFKQWWDHMASSE